MGDELKIGSLFNFIRIGIRLATGLLMVPWLLHCLGPENYALLALVIGIMGYFALLDFGLSPTVTKYVAEKVALRDARAEASLIGQCVYLFSLMGGLTAVAAACFYPFLGHVFQDLTAGQLGSLQWMFLIMAAHTVLFFPSRAFVGVLAAHQKFAVPGYVGIASTLLTVLCQILLLWAGFGPVALVASDAINSALFELWNWWYRWHIAGSAIRFGAPDWRLFGRMLRYASGIFVQQLSDLFLWGSAPVILGLTAGMVSVAVYKVGVQIPTIYMALPWAIGSVFFARIVGMVTRGAGGAELTDMMIRTARYQVPVVFVCLFGFLGAGEDFLQLWVGNSLGEEGVREAWLISLILMATLAVPLIQSLGISITQALDQNFRRAAIMFATSAASIGLGALLSCSWGAVGLAVGAGTAVAAGEIVGVNLFYRRYVGIEVGRFFATVFRGALLPFGATLLLIGWLALYGREGALSWAVLACKALAVALVFGGLMWRYWAREEEKRAFLSLLPRMLCRGR